MNTLFWSPHISLSFGTPACVTHGGKMAAGMLRRSPHSRANAGQLVNEGA